MNFFSILIKFLNLEIKFKYLRVLKKGKREHKKLVINNTASAEQAIMFGAFYCRILLKDADIHKIRPPPLSSLFQKSKKWRTERLSDWIKIRIQDFYKNAIGNAEYAYVSPEVYEALVNTFRKEAHAELMRDLRNRSTEGYVEGSTENLLMEESESLEDVVIRQMDLEILQRAMQVLTEVQKERLHMYFFQGLSVRDIAKIQDTNINAIWKSIQGSIKNLKKFFI